MEGGGGGCKPAEMARKGGRKNRDVKETGTGESGGKAASGGRRPRGRGRKLQAEKQDGDNSIEEEDEKEKDTCTNFKHTKVITKVFFTLATEVITPALASAEAVCDCR